MLRTRRPPRRGRSAARRTAPARPAAAAARGSPPRRPARPSTGPGTQCAPVTSDQAMHLREQAQARTWPALCQIHSRPQFSSTPRGASPAASATKSSRSPLGWLDTASPARYASRSAASAAGGGVPQFGRLLQALQADQSPGRGRSPLTSSRGGTGSCSTTIMSVSTGLVAWNGGRPVRHSYRIAPRAYTSVAGGRGPCGRSPARGPCSPACRRSPRSGSASRGRWPATLSAAWRGRSRSPSAVRECGVRSAEWRSRL